MGGYELGGEGRFDERFNHRRQGACSWDLRDSMEDKAVGKLGALVADRQVR